MVKISTEMIEAMLAEAEAEVAAAEHGFGAAIRRLELARQERDAFVAAVTRRRQNETPTVELPPAAIEDKPSERAASNAWVRLARTEAVSRALVELVEKDKMPASPADIELWLSEVGRDDKRDVVSAALAHLARTGRAHRVGHAKWCPGAPSENAESPAPTGLSVVPAPTSDEGRTANVESRGDRDDHLARWNDSHGQGAPSVMEG